MAFDTYMIIDDAKDVKGEATATGMTPATGWFEIYSFSFGASNPATVNSAKGGMSAGKVSISSFNIMKKSDDASPKLFAACCAGQHYPKAKIALRKATGTSGKQQIFLEYDFTDIMIESIQWSGSSGGDDTPTESVSFAFVAVSIQNWKQKDATGAVEKGNVASWDVSKVAA